METKTLSKLSEIPQELRGKTLTKLVKTFFKNPESKTTETFLNGNQNFVKVSQVTPGTSEKNFDKVGQDFF